MIHDPNKADWWATNISDVATILRTDPSVGLSSPEVSTRLTQTGPNELLEESGDSLWRLLFSQFANTMIVVLAVAVVVTVAIGDLKDAAVISAIVILNAAIGFIQEYRAERAMAALRTMASPSARIVRDGKEQTIPAHELVPGDLILVEAGDIVPADARIVECPNLRINEAALTGESVPVDKLPSVIRSDDGMLLAEQHNMIFKGTAVVYGRGRAIVVATGMNTALGQIAGLLRAHQSPRTPLQQRLDTLGRRLAAAALAVCIVVFVAGVARGEDTTTMFLVAVSLAVAAIPEALPAVVTIALALGAHRMAQQHALIRRLPAVETLGSVTVICTDKTGTLTESSMHVDHIWTFDGEIQVTGSNYEPIGDLLVDGQPAGSSYSAGLAHLLEVAVLCNDAVLEAPGEVGGIWTVGGDPTEGALLTLAAKAGLQRDELMMSAPRIAEIPFDSDRKRMTTVYQYHDNSEAVVATKGAVESIVRLATRRTQGQEVCQISSEDQATILLRAESYAGTGYRVLAFAGRPLTDGIEHLTDLEHNLIFYGLVAMADPPRPESAGAVAACRQAGITPVMITGDHPATARAIAKRIGILDQKEVLTGQDVARRHSADLASHVDQVAVFARTTPELKLDIVQAWQSRGHVVAMTGDGVNDAPALRTADIGIAMGLTGTEVAREAADMVLTDDNFATIVAAVKEGRRIYDNIRRFVRYTLTSNTGEIWVMLLGPFVGLSLPLLPVQILWINLVTDGLPGLALGVEPAADGIMRRTPRSRSVSILAHGLWQHVLGVGLFMGLVPLGLGIWGMATDRPWQTMVFTSLALLQLGHALAVRSEEQSFWSLGVFANKLLLGAVAATFALQMLVIYWSPTQHLLNAEPLDALELVIVLIAATAVFWVVECEKAVRRRNARRGKAGPAMPMSPECRR